MDSITILNDKIIGCRKCPRLVAWREAIARDKRKSFEDQEYWGKPVPYLGDFSSTRLIVGLAPAAHGANRTGRMFTGDRSGDWLFRALHKAGLANQPSSVSVDDGLELRGAMVTAVCHCAPPDNKPTPEEIGNCRLYLSELATQPRWKSILCLGSISWTQVHRVLGSKPPKFGHGVVSFVGKVKIVACYHPSQQNTFTGKLTEAMLDTAIAQWLAD